jgi:hypothetical protein
MDGGMSGVATKSQLKNGGAWKGNPPKTPSTVGATTLSWALMLRRNIICTRKWFYDKIVIVLCASIVATGKRLAPRPTLATTAQPGGKRLKHSVINQVGFWQRSRKYLNCTVFQMKVHHYHTMESYVAACRHWQATQPVGEIHPFLEQIRCDGEHVPCMYFE